MDLFGPTQYTSIGENKYGFVIVDVAEPPKLYGPHVPVIVFQTADYCTWELDNSNSLSGVLREP